jgi:hypothetical protein
LVSSSGCSRTISRCDPGTWRILGLSQSEKSPLRGSRECALFACGRSSPGGELPDVVFICGRVRPDDRPVLRRKRVEDELAFASAQAQDVEWNAMKRSNDRILTTHAGSMIRPPEVLALGPESDDHTRTATLRSAAVEVVRK